MADSSILLWFRSSRLRRHTVALVAFTLAAISLGANESEKPANKPEGETPNASTVEPTTANQGRLIRIPLPITGNSDDRVKGMIQRAVETFKPSEQRPVIVLEFSPGTSEFGQGTRFSRAMDLASFLTSRELSAVKTVAYVPRSIKGHAVLVAMACEEIIMHDEAEIGDAGADESDDEPIEPIVLNGYTQIAKRRGTITVALALGMLDKDLEVLKVETETGLEYVLRQNLKEVEARATIQSTDILIPSGELGRFNGREARQLGFVKYLARDRDAAAKALELPPQSLQDDPSLGGDWNAIEIRIDGLISASMVSQRQSMIADALRSGDVNFLLVRIDSPGGAIEESLRMANFLAGLNSSELRTVAYIPLQARAESALIAVGCDHIVMQPTAVLGGGIDRPVKEEVEKNPQPDPKEKLKLKPREKPRAKPKDRLAQLPIKPNPKGIEQDDPANPFLEVRQSIRAALSKEKGRSWSLIAALVDPTLTVNQYENAKTGAVGYFCTDELAEQTDPEAWTLGKEITNQDRSLQLDGNKAKQLGMAWEVVENFDEVKVLYGLTEDPRLVELSWAEFLIRALARPEFAALLLVIGGISIYAELQMPGIGIGAFVATVCFLLFFWSKFLDGSADWLEIILFTGGICCLLLEVFVLPGFGIFGLGGGLMMISSLVLASQRFVLPQNETEMREFQTSLLVVGGAGFGVLCAAVAMRRFLPHAPVFNRMMLHPPQGEAQQELADRESIVDFQHLLGATGETTTQLTPSGKARFGNELVDVLADGEVVDRGSEIVVIDVRGNRILVQSVVRQ